MGFSSKAKARATAGENWGMGLLFVFFPDETHEPIANTTDLFSSSPSSQSPPSLKSPIRRSNSNPILSKAQSTISICFLLVCVTFLLFTLSTFEPTLSPTTKPQTNPSRRLMSEKFPAKSKAGPNSPLSAFWLRSTWRGRSDFESKSASPYPIALQGMGALYRRGTRAMSDLIVGHLVENVTDAELRLFLRLLHRSGLTAKSDLVLVFDSLASAARFGPVIDEENDLFLQLIDRYRKLNTSSAPTPKSAASFDVTQFVKSGKTEKEPGEPLWGKKTRSNYNYNASGSGEGDTESTRVSYGSVVGFDVTELDPENSLSGFVSHVPMSLRRWACYPMLLGRVRRNFKHTMLVDVKSLLILGDPLSRVRNRGAESVLISATSPGKHAKKNSDKTHPHRPLNSAMIMGGSRGVRRLASAMLTDIARAAMQQSKKNPVTESGVLSQLAGNDIILKGKGISLVTSADPVPEASSLHSGSHSGLAVIQRGNSNSNNHHEASKVIMKQICSMEVDSSVYSDC